MPVALHEALLLLQPLGTAGPRPWLPLWYRGRLGRLPRKPPSSRRVVYEPVPERLLVKYSKTSEGTAVLEELLLHRATRSSSLCSSCTALHVLPGAKYRSQMVVGVAALKLTRTDDQPPACRARWVVLFMSESALFLYSYMQMLYQTLRAFSSSTTNPSVLLSPY